MLRWGRNIVEALLDESSYSPHSIMGINEQTSPQGPEALWSIKALSSRMVNLREWGNFGGKRMVVLTSSLSAIPCPCRAEEKNSTRGWLGCSSELHHKSDWTFLNICCGWLAPWLAEFDQRERGAACLGVMCVREHSMPCWFKNGDFAYRFTYPIPHSCFFFFSKETERRSNTF